MQRTAVFFLSLVLVAATPAGVVGATAGGGGAAATQADCSFPVTMTDATGTEVTVAEEPERITALGPSAAQTMWEIGAREKVVGLTRYADYLDGADRRTNVSGAGESYVSVEAVVGTEPDLVLAPNIVSNETVGRLRDAGLTVYRFELAESIEDVYDEVSTTGRLTGECAGAEETVSWMRDRIGTVREAVEGEDRPRVLVSQGGGWTAGSGTFVGELVEAAGGTNVAAEANVTGYQQISGEVVVERNPEFIVQIGEFGTYPRTEAYNSTDAVQNGNVITIDDNYASQPAPRIVYPIVEMAEAFHPEAYAEANATVIETSTETGTTDATAAGTTEAALQETTDVATEDGASSAVPGFGVTAALAALAGAALAAGRR